MDKIITPSLSPIGPKLGVCKHDNTYFPYYSISVGATNYNYDGTGAENHSNIKSYYVYIYDTANPNVNKTTKFLISSEVYDDKTKIDQWELTFGDGEKMRGSMGPQSYIPLNQPSFIPSNDTSITIADASQFPNSGIILIDDEYVEYKSKSGNTLNDLTRGRAGTTAVYHFNGATYNGEAVVNIGGNNLILTDASATWTSNQWAGQYVYVNDSVTKIISNTENTLTTSSDSDDWSWDVPSDGDTIDYSIKTKQASVQLVKEVSHKYIYGGGNTNGCMSVTLKVMDTRGRRTIKKIMVYPKTGI